MSKAWCIWCESGDSKTKSGYYWIHPDCAEKLIDNHSEIEHILEIVSGERKNDSIRDFLKRMYEANIKWQNVKNFIEHKRSEAAQR